MRLSKLLILLAVGVGAAIVGGLALVAQTHRGPTMMTATFDPPYPKLDANGDPIREVMEGRIACGVDGCERIKVTLVLYEGALDRSPSSYWLGIIGTRGNERVVSQGRWEIREGVDGYPDVAVYALDADAGLGLRYFWRVNDNILLVLDDQMRPRHGNAAWGFMLSRYDAPYGPRTYTWTR